jgi:hypothetical protein
MKKQILLAAACCGLAFASQAQGIKVGPRIGVNFATMAFDPEEEGFDPKSRTGLQAGLVVNIGVNEMFSIQPEILFSQKGYKVEETEDGIEGKLDVATSYLEVPILAKVQFGSGGVKPFINAGPYFGYWMGGNTKLTIDGDDIFDEDFDFDDESMDNANRMDIGLSVGAGIGFDAGPGQLTLDVRYGLGLTSLSDEPEGWDSDVDGEYGTEKNRVLGVSISYMFGGGE